MLLLLVDGTAVMDRKRLCPHNESGSSLQNDYKETSRKKLVGLALAL